MTDFFLSLWTLTLSMAPYLLLGFLIAGLLYAFIPSHTFVRHLSRPGVRSVANATLLGIPLPLCSCGVLPTTVSLRRSGASRGACTSFLIATPQTGVDSILATYSLLGLPFTVVRVVASLVTGVLGGLVTDRLFRGDAVTAGVVPRSDDGVALSFFGKLKKAFAYAFGELLEDVGRWLVVGLLVAALITVAVPTDFFGSLREWPLLNMLIVLLVAVPMYVCATGSIPIALSLMLKGMTPGAAFVLLMAGPAINAASMIVIDKAFGRRQTVIYLATIVCGAVGFGLVMDYLLPSAWFQPLAMAGGLCSDCVGEEMSWLSVVCGIFFVLLLLRALWYRYRGHGADHCCEDGADGCSAAAGGRSHEEAHSPVVLKVSGMRCSHCAANVREALEALPFVERVEVDLTSGRVEITARGEVDDDAVRQAISAAGYSVEA